MRWKELDVCHFLMINYFTLCTRAVSDLHPPIAMNYPASEPTKISEPDKSQNNLGTIFQAGAACSQCAEMARKDFILAKRNKA